jgi:hypothetical protein
MDLEFTELPDQKLSVTRSPDITADAPLIAGLRKTS